MGWKEDLNYGLAAFGVRIPDRLPIDDWAATLNGAPLRNTAGIVAASSALFLAAERGHNPKVNDIYDAMVYCSTCLSVGYADIFPRTPIGKVIGTVLMAVGPSLAARATDGLSDPGEQSRRDAIQAQILTTLQGMAAMMAPAAVSFEGSDGEPPAVEQTGIGENGQVLSGTGSGEFDSPDAAQSGIILER